MTEVKTVIRKRDVIGSLRQPKVAVMLMLGFSSGLPFFLSGNTLGYWLRDAGTTLTAIGFLSWVGLAYSLKFLWAPVVDRVDAIDHGRPQKLQRIGEPYPRQEADRAERRALIAQPVAE